MAETTEYGSENELNQENLDYHYIGLEDTILENLIRPKCRTQALAFEAGYVSSQ